MNVTELYAAIHAVDIAALPEMSTDRCIPRKEQAALCRQLLKRLGIKGVSVTVPMHANAQAVEVRIPYEEHPGWLGFEQWENASYGDMPDDVPAKARMLRQWAAREKLSKVLLAAFPAHNDRSDLQSDYFDYCWSVG